MIAHKHITKIVAGIMALAVCACLAAVGLSGKLQSAAGDTGLSMEYETALFDTSEVLSVNIIMDPADWEAMLSSAAEEEYYPCDVELGGQTFRRVGIRPKGNTSLSAIANDPDTDRYSFKLEFDHYVDGQTCFGLDKLILNNNYADATNMKEALVYDMYRYLGTDASLYNYAAVSVNGSYWGVYLALEAVEDSFLLRNYGAESGQLYKPDSMDMNMGTAPDRDFGDMDFGDTNFARRDFDDRDFDGRNFRDGDLAAGERPAGETPTPPDGAFVPSGETPAPPDGTSTPAGGGAPGGSFGSTDGADLNYTDDDLDSYRAIWDGEVTDSGKKDHQRVVAALRHAAEGTELEDAMDIDNLLRYMAVHVFSVNEDSLSGIMAHNYYLYESGGRLNLLPWDYNLAFGGMGGGKDGSSVVNSAIDDAFTITGFFDALLADETYSRQYHDYLRQLVEGYVNGGGFASFYQRTRSQLDDLVASDPTAFYTYEEYVAAAETLYQVVTLRGQSVLGQVTGTIPSTETAQRAGDSLVDASGLDISVMGTMDTGGTMGGGGGRPGGMDGHFRRQNGDG